MKKLLLCLLVGFAFTAQADTARLRGLYAQIRCPVCDGQSVEDSEATLAQDLRRLINEMVQENRSDGEIRQFLVQRYGEQILLRPQFQWENAILWGGPLFLVIVLFGSVFMRLRKCTF